MHTSIGLLAFAGSLAVSSAAENPTWHEDYGKAQVVAQQEKKPLAVVIGSGQTGFDKLCKEGKLSDETRKLLVENYVCIYLDADTAAGRKWAAAFAITQGAGLVISDRTGASQAFFHDGTLADTDLARRLKRYADPAHVVSTTETQTVAQTSNYPYAAGGSGGYYQPSYNFGSGGGGRMGGFSSGSC